MLSTNGDGRRVVLYARVSTEEQARSGYSLAQQIEALRAHAEREGYQVLEEVLDPGYSGSFLERPGMDRVRDLVRNGGVAAVLAQDRDRFAREPAYHYLLRREFEEHGCKIRSLNDRGDDSPEGELTDGILDQLAKYERAKITERTRRGRLRKAREGKLMIGRFPRYGFRLNSTRDGYELDEGRMRLVRRVFRMIGEEGMTIRAVARRLDEEDIPTPGGGKFWDRAILRQWILDDSYRPHTFEEVKDLVAPGVADKLDPGGRYGILWWGRRGVKTKQVSEPTRDGRRYRKTYRYHIRPKEEQVPIPVPDAGVPRELVDAARACIKDNRVPSAAGDRFWELSGGVARCAACGRMLRTRKRSKKKGERCYLYHYYRCSGYDAHGFEGCANSRFASAKKLEGQVWDFVRDVLLEPERLRSDLERMIQLEREGMRGDPEQEVRHWLEKLSEVDRERRGFLRLAAKGRITDNELDEELSALEEIRRTAEQEIAASRGYRKRVEQMEQDKEALLSQYARLAPEGLDSLTPEERHQLYRMLRLEVRVSKDGSLEVECAGGLMPDPIPGESSSTVASTPL